MSSNRFATAQWIVLLSIAILACVAAFVAGLLIWRTFFGPKSEPPVAGDESWQRVQSAGKLVIGTSSDYPPFEAYDANFNLTGFDVALANEIGRRLGIQVEFKDMAFDGLDEALLLGQIDAAMAAISVTPERQNLFDFTNVYYVGRDAVLANQGSSVGSVNSAVDLVNRRVGVQRSSVYEGWLKTNLVDTGLMAAGNLMSYARIDEAINDLKADRLELVVLDYNPAMNYVQQGGVQLAGEDMSQQSYAIGLRKGSNALRERLNTALAQLQNEGYVTALATLYLHVNPGDIHPPATPTPLPTNVPTPPPPPPPTATPPNYCIDGMTFVTDLTYPDYNMTNPQSVPPGIPFQKGWRLRNTGTCTWNSGYVLRYVNGNSPYAAMGGAPTPIAGVVQPGTEYDLYINLVAPLQPGVHQGFWVLTNASGAAFGNRIWVGISVPAINPATPTPPPQTPVIYRFDVTPGQISAGQCVFLSWDTRGEVYQAQILRDGQPIWPNAPINGSFQDCPPAGPGQAVSYDLFIRGPSSSDQARRNVYLYAPATPTAPPPSGPPIVNFQVSPESVSTGGCFSLSWQVVGNVDFIQLYRNDMLLLSDAPADEFTNDCPDAPGGQTYRLVASGDGKTDIQERSVMVYPSVDPTFVPPGPTPRGSERLGTAE